MSVSPIQSDSSPDSNFLASQALSEISTEVKDASLDTQQALCFYLRDVRALLSFGTTKAFTSFTFHLPDGQIFTAPSAGLEGFLYATKKLRQQGFSDAELSDQNGSFRTYLHDLLNASPLSMSKTLLERVHQICDSSLVPEDQFRDLVAAVEDSVEYLRSQMNQDPSRWIKSAGIYQLFPRAFNLPDFREFHGLPGGKNTGRFFEDVNRRDLEKVQELGFNTLWPMGIFPIGELGRKGEKGSPYSIQNHEAINPELGTEADFIRFVSLAHNSGLKVLIDFVPNHTSRDSDLLHQHPEFFVRKEGFDPKEVAPDEGHFAHYSLHEEKWYWISYGGYDSFGTRAYWTDVAQLDYSNPELRQHMIDTAVRLARKFDIDGFRVDMAYQIFRTYLERNWRDDLQSPLPEKEFISQFTYALKSEFPHIAVVAESYDLWDAHSRAGIDGLYGKCDIGRIGGHTGWYDALVSKDPTRMRDAIERTAFLNWQSGGMAMVCFTCNHDEAAPQRVLKGAWVEGATALTYLLPNTVLFFAGMEAGHDQPNKKTSGQKPISFSEPSEIGWMNNDAELSTMYNRVFRHRELLLALFSDPTITPLKFSENSQLVGYCLEEARSGEEVSRAYIIVNPSDHVQSINMGAFNGRESTETLNIAAGGYELVVR